MNLRMNNYMCQNSENDFYNYWAFLKFTHENYQDQPDLFSNKQS